METAAAPVQERGLGAARRAAYDGQQTLRRGIDQRLSVDVTGVRGTSAPSSSTLIKRLVARLRLLSRGCYWHQHALVLEAAEEGHVVWHLLWVLEAELRLAAAERRRDQSGLR